MQTPLTCDVPWRYEPAADWEQSLAGRLRRFPREPDLTVYTLRSLIALLLRGWLRLFHRLEIIGREHLPARGSFVLVANHASHLDTLCLLAAMPLRRLHRAFPAAARDYFFVNKPRSALAAVVVNAFPFRRRGNVRQSLETCRQLLASPGNVLILFPEGTRTRTGELGEFKAGIGWLVAGKALPVVPCHLAGGFAAWPPGRWCPRPRKLSLRIGAPRSYPTFSPDKESANIICAELQNAVAELGEARQSAGGDK